MGKSLLIVESPTKARTLERYLGKKFIVKASVGHIKDLPKTKLGIRIEDEFKPEYRVISGKKKVIQELNQAAKKADTILLGPDPDREGEAIAWHIAEEVKAGDKPVRRVLFYELTHKAILEALEKTHQLNKNRYEAQQARRILDRLVGYLISPLLWEKVKKGLSAGRVQSVALRLVCEREREIRAFEPDEYWSITARLQGLDDTGTLLEWPFEAQLWHCRGKKCAIADEKQAQKLVDELKAADYAVSKIEQKAKRRRPTPPFITSTLQQEAATKLRFSARQTMRIAQQLYEGVELGDEGAVGLITYMRTDSTRLSDDAVKEARSYIKERWGSQYLPAKKVVYKTKASAQDAHEAIRPTEVFRTPEQVAPFLGADALKLYTLIWKRFVACQMAPAVIDQTTLKIRAGADYMLKATGSVIRFPGFMVLYQESKENGGNGGNGEGQLPALEEDQLLRLLELLPKQHFTQPPPRFSEAALIRELEERGIGRPSTYATIVSTILEREYVKLDRRRIFPTELGMIINDLLVEYFPEILDVSFTAKMERELDEIEQGKRVWVDLLKTFYHQFQQALENAQSKMGNLKSTGWPTGLKCPKCDSELRIKLGRNGPFIACSSYPKCNFSSSYERDEKGQLKLVDDTKTDEVCEKCGRPMVIKRGRFGQFLACSGYPECKNTRPVTLGIPCPRQGCDGELVERISKRGRPFYGCTRYPDCKTVFWNRPAKIACPQCGAPFMLEKVTKKDGKHWVCADKHCGHVLKQS